MKWVWLQKSNRKDLGDHGNAVVTVSVHLGCDTIPQVCKLLLQGEMVKDAQ